jgi:SOS-response transcriptional repressor LexA
MAKTTFGVRLKQARREAGMTQKELASKAGIKQGTLSELENDKYAASAHTPQLAAALRVNALWLANEKGPKHISGAGDVSISATVPGKIAESLPKSGDRLLANTEPGPDIKGKYPLISWVQAGAWETIVDNFAPGDAEEWLDAPVRVSSSSYYLTVRGESMYDPADHRSFHEGEKVLVDPNASAEHGSFVVVRLDDESEATFKQLIIEGGRKYLKALNPNWPNRIFEVNGNATICGVVKGKFVGGY